MYLKKMELQGFKSFADKTTLEFMPGITSVIGPNGSGKSNISDAIRWVLGEQSMKSLRGSKSEDIIFAGTESRKSLGFAEVSIIIDNTDGKLPIEYSEVTVTRRLYRSGETGYFINKAPCRLKDVLELFMDTGIGKDGYSIIGQGKIDEILSNKSEDRRNIFEEAAGIVKYRVRKAESEKKLEQTKVNLLRINDILSEIEGNIEPLKNQAEKAKKFLSLREELKSIEIGLFLHNIDTYKQRIEEVVKDIEIMNSQCENEEKEQEEKQQLKDRLKIEVDELINKIEEMQNLSFESTNKIEKLNSEINVTQNRIDNNKENYDRYEVEIDEINERIKKLEEEKTAKLQKKTNLFSNKEKFQKELEEKEKALAEISSKLSEQETKIEAKKKTVQDNTDIKYEKLADINTQKINYENYGKRETTIKTETQTTISELDQNRLSKEEIAKTFYEIEGKKNNITKQLDKIKEKAEERERKIEEYDTTINNLLSETRIKESRLKFLIETEKEKEGYTKSVKSLLLDCEKDASLNKGVHGVLANLISAPKEYETAIEFALGGVLQNIVTEKEEDAKKLVEHLRKNNLGRASFLPISSVKGKKLDKVTKLNGVIGIASELVSYDKIYDGIVQNLLGRTVVVDTMDTGIELAKKNGYSFKIVTLKGDILNPSGSISGGSVAQKTVSILGRTNEIESLEKEIKTINKKIEEIKKEKDKYIKENEGIIENSKDLEKQLQEIDIVYATEHQKVLFAEQNITKLETKLASLKEELNDLQLKKEENLKLKEQIEEEIAKIDKENEDLNIEIKSFAEINSDNQKYIDDLNFDITNLKISVSSFDESESSIDEMVARIDEDIKNNKVSIENKTIDREKILTDNKALAVRIEEIKQEIENVKQEVQTSGGKVEELKNLRIEKNKKLEDTELEIKDKFKIIDDLKDQVSKLELKKSKTELELEQIVNKMWEEYEVTPNNAKEYEKPSNVALVTKKVNELRNDIKSLGSINIDSIEEYKQTKERYDFMCEQRLDLENTSAKLKKVIQEMTGIMKEQFSKQFKIINRNFGEVFKELFGGGKAELKLADEENILECGIDIEVQPPGKKLQNMMLLSGGERAFTAIALLFAILKINPSPFCVLDEIEAALDDVNVYRYAEYLKKFTKDTQFLVITHRKGTMEAADTVYGITLSMKLQ